MYVRYIAHTDETNLGLAALAYCDHLLATELPVRLVCTRASEFHVGASWSRHARLLITPMIGNFVNAVCADLASWERCFTPGVKNVLLLASAHLTPAAMGSLNVAVRQYDATYALTREAADAVERAIGLRPLLAATGGMSLT